MVNEHSLTMDQFLTDSDTGDALFVKYTDPEGVEHCDRVVRFDPQDVGKVITQEGHWLDSLNDYGSTHIDTLSDGVEMLYLPPECQATPKHHPSWYTDGECKFCKAGS